jgi:hypothetical protein
MEVVEHGGSIEGFNSYMIYFPARNIAVIALSNVSGDAPDKMAAKLLDVTLGKTVTLAKLRVAVPIAKGEHSQFVGDYKISAQLSLNITASDEGLVVLATGPAALAILLRRLGQRSPTVLYACYGRTDRIHTDCGRSRFDVSSSPERVRNDREKTISSSE